MATELQSIQTAFMWLCCMWTNLIVTDFITRLDEVAMLNDKQRPETYAVKTVMQQFLHAFSQAAGS